MGAGEGVSVARTLSWSAGCLGGSGMSVTMVAWMVLDVEFASPQVWPEWKSHAQPRSRAAAAPCSANEPASPPPSCSLLLAMPEPRVFICVAIGCACVAMVAHVVP